MKRLLLAFIAFLVIASCVEIKMKHKERSPLEAKMFIEFMNRGPLIEGVVDTMSNLFPSGSVPSLYSYP